MSDVAPLRDEPLLDRPVSVEQGSSPVILAFPHSGTAFPAAIEARLNETGRVLSDTDWHLDRLYEGLLPGATAVRAQFHRYVIDANRDPSGASLYPGRNTTGLVPLTDFDGRPIWREGEAPEAAEVELRRAAFHAPYHAALAAEIERVKALHGVAILYDCHSIRSVIPYLFEGRLPDMNLGTDHGRTCAPLLQEVAVAAMAGADFVVNGRFVGGWTTRHYGRPGEGVHALQMELAQATHLAGEVPPYAYDEAKAAPLRARLADLLARLQTLAPQLSETSR
ncbi:N-formylglutamate deformylase [Aurantimonas sp. Leaf443]|uniref:N-formylglutamate deformylase n=1 Tax=Aurantimonas sp. Leaf443 TaxID=1736378 RepID=UPI0006FF2E94|nr:N-formylglutamate deformylase [Aurantimonas sp. Leaf443]KQT85487.1 N-formylglutamate deformylase [Aurantimonas sp. Leaf443]